MGIQSVLHEYFGHRGDWDAIAGCLGKTADKICEDFKLEEFQALREAEAAGNG
jgi:hypothetical protein